MSSSHSMFAVHPFYIIVSDEPEHEKRNLLLVFDDQNRPFIRILMELGAKRPFNAYFRLFHVRILCPSCLHDCLGASRQRTIFRSDVTRAPSLVDDVSSCPKGAEREVVGKGGAGSTMKRMK